MTPPCNLCKSNSASTISPAEHCRRAARSIRSRARIDLLRSTFPTGYSCLFDLILPWRLPAGNKPLVDFRHGRYSSMRKAKKSYIFPVYRHLLLRCSSPHFPSHRLVLPPYSLVLFSYFILLTYSLAVFSRLNL